MPHKSGFAKTYCTLREAFDLVGTTIFPTKWQGVEANCNPARAEQRTDSRTLLRKLGKPPPERLYFAGKRRPVPKRPIDDKDGANLNQAIKRHTKTLDKLLRLTHNGLVPTEFIPDNETTAREAINPSAWPDPAEFDPKNPSWGDLWFDIAADRIVLKSPRTLATSGRGHDYGDLWWAYTGRPGHVEIDRGALEKALRPPEDKGAGLSREAQKKGGARRKYNKGLQSFIDQLSTKFVESNKPLSLSSLKEWLSENALDEEPYESNIPNCHELVFVEGVLYWKNRRGDDRSLKVRSLEPYIQRAKQP